MTTQQNQLLKYGALAAAAVAGYEFVYKPWKAQKDALAIGPTSPLSPVTGGGSTYNPGGVSFPAGSGGGGGLPPYVDTGLNNPPAPYVTGPTSPVGIQPSNLDPGAAVGGPVGTAMHRKNWTQQYATDRLNAIVSGYNNSVSALSALTSGQSTAQAQAALAAEQNALQGALVAYNNAIKAGDVGGANQWKAAIDGHNQDIADLSARINSVQSSISAYENTIAGLRSDYYALTGLSLG